MLWPAGTFVDFDRGLNRAISRLRDALRDVAESPRFIETLPRRGYRFIAPVNIAQAEVSEASLVAGAGGGLPLGDAPEVGGTESEGAGEAGSDGFTRRLPCGVVLLNYSRLRRESDRADCCVGG